MTVMQLTQQLAFGIQESDELKAYFAAKAAYEQDGELQNNLFEYETQRKILGNEFSKPTEEQNPDLIVAIRDRIQALASLIVESPNYRAYEDAKQAVNHLMEEVNAEISRIVFGVQPSSCTHDCSTCSGCH